MDRSSGYTDFSDAPDVPTPKMPFPMSVPSFKDFETCVRRARNGSAPGPNGIPYTVWKYCPSLEHRLYTIVRKVWQSAEIPTFWCQASIVLFHKKGETSDPACYNMQTYSSDSAVRSNDYSEDTMHSTSTSFLMAQR